MHTSGEANLTNGMSLAEATDLYEADGGPYSFHRATSFAGDKLARTLRRGRNANPNVSPTIRTAEELERRLEAISTLRNLRPAEQSAVPRPLPADGDLKAMLSDAGRDARYVKSLTQGSGGMFTGSNIAEALRVVRGLRPKLEAIWSIYETMPKPDVAATTPDEQDAFWRKMDTLAMRADAP